MQILRIKVAGLTNLTTPIVFGIDIFIVAALVIVIILKRGKLFRTKKKLV